uniref:Uncharacterized protein n=1 Tax=Glossina palpalis gambiensis TaxID=67801 RepID=A0A1B0C6Q5_9MUSC
MPRLISISTQLRYFGSFLRYFEGNCKENILTGTYQQQKLLENLHSMHVCAYLSEFMIVATVKQSANWLPSTISPIVIVLRSTSTIRNAPSVVANARNVLGFLDIKSKQRYRAAGNSSTLFLQNCLVCGTSSNSQYTVKCLLSELVAVMSKPTTATKRSHKTAMQKTLYEEPFNEFILSMCVPN